MLTSLFLWSVILVSGVSSKEEKRLLLDEQSSALRDIEQLQAQMATVLKKVASTNTQGSVYTRWGRNVCSGNGSTLVYNGYAGGSHYTHTGAAANYICLPQDPQWGYYEDTVESMGKVYGAEYQTSQHHSNRGDHFFGEHIYDEDVPCAVCESPRSKMLMIPARQDCYPGWTREYHGYLMAGKYLHVAATEYACMDIKPEVEVGGHADTNGALFYFVEGMCGSLKCPPYVQGRELTCVVCTR